MGWGSGNLGGGSGGLNFKVIGGLTQPTNPTENTIWVNTGTTISSYVFAAAAPSTPAEGMVWFSTGTSSTVAFNALKNNAVEVYPISAKQYVSGAWVDKKPKSYQNGEWVDWYVWDGALFPENPGILVITGGWVGDPKLLIESRPYAKSGEVAEDAIFVSISGSEKSANIVTENEIDMTGFSCVKFTIANYVGGGNIRVGVYKKGETKFAAELIVKAEGEHNLEIPGGGGKYRIGCGISTSSSTRSFYVTEVRLLK